jgi:2-dehydropantoate 2-reductase
MKTLIVGTGIIGVIYGWALSEAGVDVTHFVRQGRRAQFKDGITLDILDERKGHPKKQVVKYDLKCVETVAPADGYELILVPTNGHQTEEALQALAPASGQAVFLLFTGNWEGTAFIDRLLPRGRYLLGYPDGGGTVRDGVYWTNLGAEVHLGEADGRPSETLDRVKALFARADMTPDVPENMLHWLWAHNVMSTPFAVGVRKHGDLQAYLRDTALLRECFRAMLECGEVCRRRGVDLAKNDPTGTFNLPPWLFPYVFRFLFATNESMQRFTAHAVSPGSLQETKMYYTDILKTAGELGVEVPHMQALAAYLS